MLSRNLYNAVKFCRLPNDASLYDQHGSKIDQLKLHSNF